MILIIKLEEKNKEKAHYVQTTHEPCKTYEAEFLPPTTVSHTDHFITYTQYIQKYLHQGSRGIKGSLAELLLDT